MHLVDEPRLQILANDSNAAADPDVFATCRIARLRQCRVNAARHEIKGCAAVHDNGFAGVMRQNKHWHMIGRVIAPPPFPVVVRPLPTARAEHVPPHDPRPDVRKSACRKFVIDIFAPAAHPEHGPECSGFEGPLVQISPARSERAIKRLVWSSAIAIKRDGKAFNTQSGHAAK